MEMPAELLEAFERLHQAGQKEESPPDEPYAKSLEKTNRKLEALNQSWDEIEKAATAFADAVQAEIEAGARPDLDVAVILFKEQERRFRLTFSSRLQVQKEMKRAFFALPHSVRAQAVASNRKQIATYSRLLEGIRALALRLLELRALAMPSEDARPATS